MTKKLDLHIEDLEDRIAPALLLPNGTTLFSQMMVPNGDSLFPTLERFGEDVLGPWNAHIHSPAIDPV